MRISKTILVKYVCEKFQALNASGTTFILTVEQQFFGGLITRRKDVKVEVPDNSLSRTKTNWDIAIKGKCSVRV